MKASVCTGYGSPDNIQIQEVPRPAPGPDEVLVRVHATTVSSADDRILRASPPLIRVAYGLRKPRKAIFGSSFSGLVEQVGAEVTRFAAGDRVFGTTDTKLGTHAEYMKIKEDGLIFPLPEGIEFEQAACIPFGFSTALFFLRKAKVGSGQKVLVVGAAGALGSAGVQLARHFGASVVGVCGQDDKDLVESLGAAETMDYRSVASKDYGSDYDVVFDTAGKIPIGQVKALLNQGGRYVSAVHISPPRVLKGLWVSLASGRKVSGGISVEKKDDLDLLAGLVAAGEIEPVIGEGFEFAEIAQAYGLFREGRRTGNTLVRL